MNNITKLIILIFLLFIVAFLSIFVGSVNVFSGSISEIFNETNSFIIFKLRIPRIILGICAGVALSVSGLVYQTILKTSLAEPYLLGVSSGASFGVGVAILIGDMFVGVNLPYFPFALLGSFLSIAIIFVVLRRRYSTIYALIFIGLSVSFLFNAGLTLIFSLLGNRSSEVLNWLFGSLAKSPSYFTLFFMAIVTIIFFVHMYKRKNVLDLMYLPDEIAETSAVHVWKWRMLFFVTTSLITAFIVAWCGVIGFVGLMVPHIARRLFPANHKWLLPATALIGAIMLVVSDDLSRSIISLVSDYGRELPIGVVTSLIGAPFFIYLISKSMDGGED